jgi:hypothetical protein
MSTTEDDATKAAAAAAAAAATTDAKMEDTTAAAVAATKAVDGVATSITVTTTNNPVDNPVGTTEATIAAAARAAGALVEVPQEEEQPPPVSPQEEAGSIQLAQQHAVNVGRVSLLSDVDGQGKRRFFPRVKHLIGNKEWEDVSFVSATCSLTFANMRHVQRRTSFLLFLSLVLVHVYQSINQAVDRSRILTPPVVLVILLLHTTYSLSFAMQFLTQVLQCIEEAGAPETAAASHKANNAWYKAFDLIYGGVAREYSIPTGKNRYHKFKDKVLEVWVALESQAPGENHCRELAMDQYERYKRACSEANKTGSNGGGTLASGGSGVNGNKASKTGAGQTPGSASYKLAGGKRSYSTAMGGGASLPSAGSQSHGLWKNLDEKAVLEGLPATLRSLVHLKQLSKEMAAGTANRAARRGIEEHSKKLDGAYLEALTEYLKESGDDDDDDDDDDETEEEHAVESSKEAAVGENGETKATDEESPDVEMDDGSGEAAAEAATTTEPSTGGDDDKSNGETESSYDRCLAVAFLYRYASTLHEQRVLADSYARYTERCVTFAKEEQPPPVAAVAPQAAPTGATDSTIDEATEATVVSDEATAAAAAAAAMEENPAFSVQI